jgi:hypothetical protein
MRCVRIQILAFGIVAAMAAAALPACKKSEVSEKSIKPQTAIEEKQDKSVSGERQARMFTIRSNFPCKESSDCTFTKFANVPKSGKDCACLASCTPFVINATERDRREAANREFCDVGKRSASGCPSPPCSFIAFDQLDCMDSRCAGRALIE